jgi:hypothetical protein
VSTTIASISGIIAGREVIGCGHWRTHDGQELDLIVERGDGGVLAFEVKAAVR